MAKSRTKAAPKAANVNAAPEAEAEETTVLEIDHTAFGRSFKARLSATFNAVKDIAANQDIKFLKGAELFNALVQFDGVQPIEATSTYFNKLSDPDGSTPAMRKWDEKGNLVAIQNAGEAPVTDKKGLKAKIAEFGMKQFEKLAFGGGLKFAA